MALEPQAVLDALTVVKDPDLHRDIVSLGFIKDLTIDGGRVAFTIELTTPACPVKEQMRDQSHAAVMRLPGVTQVDVTMGARVREAAFGDGPRQPIPGVKNIIAVGAGKGGVGKTTVAINLALALSRAGSRVGVIDGDIYGPNVPIMLGITNTQLATDGKRRDHVPHRGDHGAPAGVGESLAPAGDAGVGGDLDEHPRILEHEGFDLRYLDAVVGTDGGRGVAALRAKRFEAEQGGRAVEERPEPVAPAGLCGEHSGSHCNSPRRPTECRTSWLQSGNEGIGEVAEAVRRNGGRDFVTASAPSGEGEGEDEIVVRGGAGRFENFAAGVTEIALDQK